MEAASVSEKPIAEAAKIVAKIPNWAAAPKNSSLGFLSSGPKSIIAPIPIKSKSGIASDAEIPTLNSQSTIPFTGPIPAITWSTAPEKGMLTRIAPKPIGKSSAGSSFLEIARKISTPPTANITICCHVSAANPSTKNSIGFSFVVCCNLLYKHPETVYHCLFPMETDFIKILDLLRRPPQGSILFHVPFLVLY